MALKAFRRYEKKFQMTEEQMNQLLPLLSEHMDPDRYCQLGQTYTICNVYYDTDDSRVIRNSLSKPYYKEKLRLRSYGTPSGSDSSVFLEMKKKIGGLVTKRRAELSYKDAQNFLENRRIPQELDYMNCQVLREIEYFLSQYPVKPAVFISYERSAFFDRTDPEFRLTFDRKLLSRRENPDLLSGNYGTLLMPQNFRLMEVKVSKAFPTWLADALCDMGLFSSSFSKYGREYLAWLEEKWTPFPQTESGAAPSASSHPYIFEPEVSHVVS